ncbi:hypothetical protein [Burkholderia territorii]|uniref:hypothetical protein n=1 Tax=Burkholderia territorii TaxID=1503055 RepID=UPI000A6E6DD2|nr:hypothetical protein [Burkholderia territorii]
MSGNWVYHDGPVNPKPRFVVEYHRHAPENATIDALLARIPSRKRNAVMLEILRIAADTIAREPSLERRLGLAPSGPPAHFPPHAAHPAAPPGGAGASVCGSGRSRRAVVATHCRSVGHRPHCHARSSSSVDGGAASSSRATTGELRAFPSRTGVAPTR